jgi:RimJ/RimL family protein N-acetyltransferase
MHKIYTKVLETNVSSMKVLLNNNYQIEGYQKDQFFQNGRYLGMFLFARTGYGD